MICETGLKSRAKEWWSYRRGLLNQKRKTIL